MRSFIFSQHRGGWGGSLQLRIWLRAALASLILMGPMAALPGPAFAKGKAAAKVSKKARKKARKKAKRYAKKAKRAFKKKRWDEAIVSFELAFEINPEPRYLFNIGRCYEQKGDLFKAMEYVQAYADAVEDASEREDAHEVREILRGKLARTSGEVTVTSDPTGAVVTLHGSGRKVQGTAPLSRWLEAGTWELEVALQDHKTIRDELVVQVGEGLEKTYSLETKSPKAASAAAAKPAKAKSGPAATKGTGPTATAASPSSSEARASGDILPYAALWGGIALVAGGGFFGWQASQTEAEVQGYVDEEGKGTVADARSLQSDAEAQAMTANILFGVGVAAAVTGGWLVFDGAARVAVAPARNGGVLVWHGRWP